MPDIRPSDRIRGVRRVRLTPFADERGSFVEIFRKEWFPERTWTDVQANRSDSRKDVLRGLHYHRHQVDYWIPVRGRFRVGLVDLRRGSPTRGSTEMLELDAGQPAGLFIPVGVAHGFLALTDATLHYIVDGYYDATDEHGVAWNDPDLGIDWDIERPVLSPRDQGNPRLHAISEDVLPA